MKKPPCRKQRLLLLHLGEKRTCRYKKRQKSQKKTTSSNPYQAQKNTINLPEIFSLSENYLSVIEKIDYIRDHADESCYLNFDRVKKVNVAGALMLVAELEIMHTRDDVDYNWKAFDSKWDKEVRDRLKEMGFYDILKVKSETPNIEQQDKHEVFIKFISGVALEGESINKIIKEVQNVFHSGQIVKEIRIPLYNGISETITNTYQHAYSSAQMAQKIKRWWISASINKKTKEIKVVCYDRGLTIPVTLKNSEAKRSFFDVEIGSADHELIKSAMEVRRTSTKKPSRGHGLTELVHLIEQNKQGTLRVYSGEGMLEYKFDRENLSHISRPLYRKLRGTLVEWNIIPREVG